MNYPHGECATDRGPDQQGTPQVSTYYLPCLLFSVVIYRLQPPTSQLALNPGFLFRILSCSFGEKSEKLVHGRCKVYPRWLNSWVIYKGIAKGSQNKDVCHFKVKKKRKGMKYPFPVPSPNHNNFGRPCTQFRLMYTIGLCISQEFNHTPYTCHEQKNPVS